MNQNNNNQTIKLVEIVNRQVVPDPWDEGDNIPWYDPDFSKRMLKEHLSQHHDAASRRIDIIDKHVDWIHNTLLLGRPIKILDLGCGPGLYTSRLSRRGHTCLGIDYSPAAINYAKNQAEKQGLDCSYIHQDIRTAEYGSGYGLVMLIFGEFNVFRPVEAREILNKAYLSLVDGGTLLLEPHTFAAVKNMGEHPPSWYSATHGLFSDQPHICLSENIWDSSKSVTTSRYYVLDVLTGKTKRYAQSIQAYDDDQYQSLLREYGFNMVEFYTSLGSDGDSESGDLIAIVGSK